MTEEEFDTILSNEIINDPKNLGLAAMTNKQIVDKLTEIGASGETKPRTSVQMDDIRKAIVANELGSLTTNQLLMLNLFVSGDTINPSDANIREIFKLVFGSNTQTRTNLLELASEPASRAEVLGLDGLRYWHVARMRAE